MSNPWLKKNPFMSMWLSGANSVASSARGRIAAEAKRQSTIAVNKAASEMFSIWTNAMGVPRAEAKEETVVARCLRRTCPAANVRRSSSWSKLFARNLSTLTRVSTRTGTRSMKSGAEAGRRKAKASDWHR